jgi:D-alanyl-D-alanine carboxypeptidase
MLNKLFLSSILILMLCLPTIAQDDFLDDLLADYVFDDEASVVVYVRYGDEDALAVRGLADIGNGIPATTDSLYRIASITKPFVATVILQLVEEGLVALDDPIADYLPDEIVSRIENADSATIRQMLQMTSGIYSYTDSDAFADAVYDNPSYTWTASETLTYAYDEEAYFPAGEGYEYSNSNYNLAHIIIESLTEQTLAEGLQTRIFERLDMTSCYLETPDRFAQGIVRGYEYYDKYEDVTETNDGVGLGDGGIVCTAEDLAKFLPNLDQLLIEDSLSEMLDTVDDSYGGQYGLGIGYDETEFGMVLAHDGATSGFQSTMQYLVDEDLIVVVLTNDFTSEIVEDLAYDTFYLALDE